MKLQVLFDYDKSTPIILDVKPKDTVGSVLERVHGSVKTRLWYKYSLEQNNVLVLVKGESILDESRTLSYYNVQHNSTVNTKFKKSILRSVLLRIEIPGKEVCENTRRELFTKDLFVSYEGVYDEFTLTEFKKLFALDQTNYETWNDITDLLTKGWESLSRVNFDYHNNYVSFSTTKIQHDSSGYNSNLCDTISRVSTEPFDLTSCWKPVATEHNIFRSEFPSKEYQRVYEEVTKLLHIHQQLVVKYVSAWKEALENVHVVLGKLHENLLEDKSRVRLFLELFKLPAGWSANRITFKPKNPSKKFLTGDFYVNLFVDTDWQEVKSFANVWSNHYTRA